MAKPDSLQALYQNACRAHQGNDFPRAEQLYREFLKGAPHHADAWHQLGLCCMLQGRPQEGIQAIQEAIRLNPKAPFYQVNLGKVFAQLNQDAEAEHLFRGAVRLAPNEVEALSNLAQHCKKMGQMEEAERHYLQAIQLKPAFFRAHLNLGTLYIELGRYKSALQTLEVAVRLEPENPFALNNLGIALGEWDRNEEALDCFKRALKSQPDFLPALNNRAMAHEKRGELDDAQKIFRRMALFDKEQPGWSQRADILAPIIPQSNEEIDQFRATLSGKLDGWIQSPTKLSLQQLFDIGFLPPSELLYQGRDDLPLKQKFSQYIQQIVPPQDQIMLPSSSDGRRHVGFLVTSGHEGVFIKGVRGLIQNLPADRFRITIICSPPNGLNILQPALVRTDLEYLLLSRNVAESVEKVRAARLDCLYFWEIGTDSTNYLLAAHRLAPRQVSSWGWPITSALPTMDAFISQQHLERQDADAHYTEQLLRTQRLPLFYYRPPVPATPLTRSQLGLPEDKQLYVCPQNIRKIHPDCDPLFAEILRRDANGLVLLVEDKLPELTARLKQRLERSAGDVLDRIRILPRLPESDYLSLLCVSDVELDTLFYGGGGNTCYDAAACGLPVVTLPGTYHRSRFAFATAHQLGILDGVASSEADYVERAVRIAQARDPELRSRIREASAVLFEDRAALDELIALL